MALSPRRIENRHHSTNVKEGKQKLQNYNPTELDIQTTNKNFNEQNNKPNRNN